jgi:hypothetical protein
MRTKEQTLQIKPTQPSGSFFIYLHLDIRIKNDLTGALTNFYRLKDALKYLYYSKQEFECG